MRGWNSPKGVTSPDVEVAPTYAAKAQGPVQVDVVSFLTQQVDELNATLAAQGSSMRLDYPWLFTVGGGTDPYARLRTGSRWPMLEPECILDESDSTTDLPAAQVEAALVAAYHTWNAIPNSALEAVRVDDPGTNMDVLDGTYDPDNCVFLYDVYSPSTSIPVRSSPMRTSWSAVGRPRPTSASASGARTSSA